MSSAASLNVERSQNRVLGDGLSDDRSKQHEEKTREILNQKRNFRKIGLRGGHTRYEEKKKWTPTSNETEISNEINDFQTVHEL